MKGRRAIGSAQYYIFTSVCTFKNRPLVLFVKVFYLCSGLFPLMLIKTIFRIYGQCWRHTLGIASLTIKHPVQWLGVVWSRSGMDRKIPRKSRPDRGSPDPDSLSPRSDGTGWVEEVQARADESPCWMKQAIGQIEKRKLQGVKKKPQVGCKKNWESHFKLLAVQLD